MDGTPDSRFYLKIFLAATLAGFVLFNTNCDSIRNGREKDGAHSAGLPAAVDNSTLRYFPPIGKQKIGDCTCWSSCYYYNTYTQARDHGFDASKGDPKVLCSPRFLFSLLCQGSRGAEGTETAMKLLSKVGCATVAEYPMDTPWTKWPGERTRIAALRNRTGRLHRVRADNAEGLEEIKSHIAKGGCAVTRALFRANYPSYGKSASGPGIDNGVMYAKVGANWLRHSLCICGYDDGRSYFDDRDGKTHSGAFLIANSEGPEWGACNSTGKGAKGFIWVAYAMFLEGNLGIYDHDDNPHTDPCFDNPPYPTIYYHDDRPDYTPSLYAVVGINHEERNRISLSGGIGPVSSPEFIGPEVIERTEHGAIPISDAKRVVIDLSDGSRLIGAGTPEKVFVKLSVDSRAAGPASMTSADFYFDPDGDGIYSKYSSKNPAVLVEPGREGFASVKISLPRDNEAGSP